jgi:hypothetical protein
MQAVREAQCKDASEEGVLARLLPDCRGDRVEAYQQHRREDVNWQPIETAPETGVVLVTDGLVFGAAKRFDYVQPAEINVYIGYKKKKAVRPNPRAGQLDRSWSAIAGWSAWDECRGWMDSDRFPPLLKATHWMPLFEPPK